MLSHVYFSAAKVGVGFGFGEDFAGRAVVLGDDEGLADGDDEHPASVARVASANTPTARRRAIEGPAMVSRIGQ
jgi:hypothetical protein